jgi:hypothetical protein
MIYTNRHCCVTYIYKTDTWNLFFYVPLSLPDKNLGVYVMLAFLNWNMKPGKILFGVSNRGAPKGGLLGCSSPQTQNLKNTDFVYIVSKVLHHFSFSQNQPLKSAAD